MSGNPFDSVIIPEDTIRDFLYTQPGNANQAHDLGIEMNAIGLDVFIRNRGAAALTISINGQAAITVDAGAVYTLNGVKFYLVEIVSAVQYDFQMAGIRVVTLQRRGLIK